MMHGLEVFTYANQRVRLVGDVEPRFVLADLCRVLELSNPSMVAARLDADDLSLAEVIDSMGRTQSATVVSEAGMYDVVTGSNSPAARPFHRWVTHEVLPQIRRTGSYSKELSRRDLAVMVIESEDARERAELQLAEAQPKVEMAERFLSADGDMSIRDAALALQRAGVETGERRLFQAMQRMHWIYKARGDGRWRPYQDRVEAGLLAVVPRSHEDPYTRERVIDPPQVRVTPKGLQRLHQDFLAVVGGE